jgi:dihydrofolate synthase/folylpolyglutamate synthase
MSKEAARTIESKAAVTGSILARALLGVSAQLIGHSLNIRTPIGRYRNLRPLSGAHQRTNLIVAIRTLEALQAAGVPIDLSRAVPAMSHALWPGRLERFGGRPPVLIDGAHNPAGARALAAYLKETGEPHVLVFGAMRDKHFKEMAAELFPLARLVIATRVRMSRAATTAHLAEVARAKGRTVVEEPSVRLALERAMKLAKRGETVVIAGSLYLVGAVRRRLLGMKSPAARASR